MATAKTVKKSKRGKTNYGLKDNGELWVLGRYGYLAGHVSSPDRIEEAITSHEAELRVLMDEARREFGF